MAKASEPREPKEITPVMAALGKRVAQARDFMGLTQAELGAELGVQSTQVSRWERGENRPKDDQLAELAERAKVDYAWLVTGKGSPRGLSGVEAKGSRVAPHESLQSVLDRFRVSLSMTDDEVKWLSSQRFPEGLGDIGTDEWWLEQFHNFRNFVRRRKPTVSAAKERDVEPVAYLPRNDKPPRGDEPPRKRGR